MAQQDTSSMNNNVLGVTLAVLLMRIWLGFRAFLSGVEKYAGKETVEKQVIVDGRPVEYELVAEGAKKVYSLDSYHGVPAALMDKFEGEPLIPGFMLGIYDTVLGPLLIVLGLTVLLGIFSRISLFVMGLVYTSLTFGLILINQPSGVAWLATHVILIVLMLIYAGYNRFEVGGLLKKK
ncbi:hypothetical protein [Rubellicoccus peritrichatus]|uniref:DoxX family protein n=1 Tax=Rubellicoccus peritrichatus TaxID=3080537 RepID=A0AAQ3QQF6_9BACT|nr:hypothetical protein [Puniceicoccus sp. CR14]WOO40193.1 hypothetical protein RZN69_16350 [Puniceicoccus sp. CR14]